MGTPTRLGIYLRDEQARTSASALEVKTGLTRLQLDDLMSAAPNTPELGVLLRLAERLAQPLWSILEWANVPLELPDDTDHALLRFAQLLQASPIIKQHPQLLLALAPCVLDELTVSAALRAATHNATQSGSWQ